jgi:hypothetical protein
MMQVTIEVMDQAHSDAGVDVDVKSKPRVAPE